MKKLAISERRACKVLGQHRSTQRKKPTKAETDAGLTEAIIHLASQYGRYGYRMITALLRVEGWFVNHKRVERIWRREGLKVPKKQPKATLVNDGTTLLYRASKHDCDPCPMKSRCCPKAPVRKVPRSIYEGARDMACDIAKTDAYVTSRRQ